MVCAKCEAKLPRLAVQDKHKWAAGGKPAGSSSSASSSGPMKKPAGSSSGASIGKPCRVCKSNVHLAGAHYCQGCAYKNGICAMCGTKVLDTSSYKMSSK